jgi:hypothetical protein
MPDLATLMAQRPQACIGRRPLDQTRLIPYRPPRLGSPPPQKRARACPPASISRPTPRATGTGS